MVQNKSTPLTTPPTTPPASPSVVIAAGGTGGHVFPAIAVAQCLREQAVAVTFIGVGGMEKTLIEKENFSYHAIKFASPKKASDYIHLLVAVVKSVFLLRRLRPKVVLAMGGYPAVPSGLAAWLCRVPLLLHEQNARRGRANNLLSRFATRCLQGFDGTFSNGHHTGTPVRQSFFQSLAAATPADKTAMPPTPDTPLRLLVVGGSQGAMALNTLLPPTIAQLQQQGLAVSVTHQTGAAHCAATQTAYDEQKIAGGNVRVVSFIDNMADAMQNTDLMICRAGAATMAEIAIVGVAAILIPLPTAAADHQTANARYFSDKQAAVLLPEKDATPAALAALIKQHSQPDARANLCQRAKQLGAPNANEAVMQHCLYYAT